MRKLPRKIVLQLYATKDHFVRVRLASHPANATRDPFPTPSLLTVLGARAGDTLTITRAPKTGRYRLDRQNDPVFSRVVTRTAPIRCGCGNMCLTDLRALAPGWTRPGVRFNVKITRDGTVVRDA